MGDCEMLKIGISSPITVSEFLSYLDDTSRQCASNIIGLKAPAVDAVVHELLKRGYKVAVYSLDYSISDYLILKGEKLKIILGPGFNRSPFSILGIFTYKTSVLRKCILLDDEQPDILHAEWTHEFALAALSVQINSKVVVTVRDWAPKVLKLFWYHYYFYIHYVMDYRVFHNKRAYIVANSDFMASQILKRWKLKVPVLPNPVGRFFMDAKAKEGHNPFIIISISNNVSPLKNITNLLLAFKHLYAAYREKVEMHLVGSQFIAGNSKVQEWQKKGLLEGVVLRGFIPHNELPQLFTNVDMMVHPSLEESFGNILIEAMSQNVLVVGGEKSGAVPSILCNGKYGLLCDVTKPLSIATVMKNAYLHFSDYKPMISEALRYVKDNYSVDKVTDMHLMVYKKVLEG